MAAAPAARGSGATGAGAAGGAGMGGRGGPGRLAPGLGRGPRPPGGRGPPPGDGGVWVAELGHLGDHQGVEEPGLRCRAPPEGRGEPGSTPGGGGVAREDQGRVLRAVIRAGWARPGADMAGFPGGGGGAPRHGRGGQQLAAPGPAHRPHPLALPPEEPARRRSPDPHASGSSGDGHARRQWSGAQHAGPRTPGDGHGGGGGSGPTARDTPPAGPGPPILSGPPTPPQSAQREDTRRPRSGRRAGTTDARTGAPLTRRPLTTNR